MIPKSNLLLGTLFYIPNYMKKKVFLCLHIFDHLIYYDKITGNRKSFFQNPGFLRERPV